MVTHIVNVIGAREGAGWGGEIILLNCCKWLQINSTYFTVRSLWVSLERTVGQPQRTQSSQGREIGKEIVLSLQGIAPPCPSACFSLGSLRSLWFNCSF